MSKRQPSINDLKAKAGAKYGSMRSAAQRQIREIKQAARRKEEQERAMVRRQAEAAYRAAHPELFPEPKPRKQRAPGIFVSFMNGFISGNEIQEVFDQLDAPSKQLIAIGDMAAQELADGDRLLQEQPRA